MGECGAFRPIKKSRRDAAANRADYDRVEACSPYFDGKGILI